MAFTRKKIAPPVLVALAALTASPTLAQERIIRDMFSIGGALIINGMEQRNRQQQTQAPRQRSVDPAAAQRAAEERERMRFIQSRLNALGYDAGTPDGVSGPRTRRAIANFQASIGEAETGTL
ncbi:peptidoglycan-binding domain-containing protein, partial [Devosia sp.]|uniref:peptidoglycan-binding domain-containing protein n=1 Tax=Devosia sp. TaxID=1871048 RepID=UPI002AFDDC46